MKTKTNLGNQANLENLGNEKDLFNLLFPFFSQKENQTELTSFSPIFFVTCVHLETNKREKIVKESNINSLVRQKCTKFPTLTK